MSKFKPYQKFETIPPDKSLIEITEKLIEQHDKILEMNAKLIENISQSISGYIYLPNMDKKDIE